MNVWCLSLNPFDRSTKFIRNVLRVIQKLNGRLHLISFTLLRASPIW